MTTRFVLEYKAKAAQFATFELGRAWAVLAGLLEAKGITLTADDAAGWANLGYMPMEALPHILAGVTAETAGELDDLESDLAGGPELHAMQTIDELVARGEVIDPARVHWREDPDDPAHIIVDVDPA